MLLNLATGHNSKPLSDQNLNHLALLGFSEPKHLYVKSSVLSVL